MGHIHSRGPQPFPGCSTCISEPSGPVSTEVADRLIPELLNVWASASMSGQTDAAVEAAAELDKLLRQDVA